MRVGRSDGHASRGSQCWSAPVLQRRPMMMNARSGSRSRRSCVLLGRFPCAWMTCPRLVDSLFLPGAGPSGCRERALLKQAGDKQACCVTRSWLESLLMTC
jgi:hypothetical protein